MTYEWLVVFYLPAIFYFNWRQDDSIYRADSNTGYWRTRARQILTRITQWINSIRGLQNIVTGRYLKWTQIYQND